PLVPAGPIILQTHGGETRWRNLTVKEIPRGMPESGHLLPDGTAAGEGWSETDKAMLTVGADAHAVFGPLTGEQTATVLVGTRLGVPGPVVGMKFAADGTVSAGNPLGELAGLRPDGEPAKADPVPIPGFHLSPDAAEEAFDPAAENHVYLRATDGSVMLYLNGSPVLIAVDAPGSTDGSVPFGLSGHGSDIRFVRAEDDRADPPTDEADFTAIPLLPDLAGWEGDVDGYSAQDGILTCKGGNLYLKEELSDFTVRFEFRLPPGGNNGVGLRFVKGENAAYQGMESQLLDNAAPVYDGIQPWQSHGSIYGVVPALRGYLAPAGHWNREEIRLDGDRVTVILNGKTIVDADIREASANGTIDGREHPGLLRKSGAFGFLGHGAPVAWRNLRLSVPDPADPPPASSDAGPTK
ncbi:MAG: family 16 glycoside hydrolase, partial [Planctomycetota bacterium]